MFCKNCGTQIPDGAVACPNCGAPVQAAPNAGAQAAGQTLAKSGKSLSPKMIGIIVAAVAAVLVLVLILKAVLGGSKYDGVYTDGSSAVTLKGNKITMSVSGIEFTAKYKIKGKRIIINNKSLKINEDSLDYLEELGLDSDEIEDMVEDLMDEAEDSKETKQSFKYSKKDGSITLDGKTYYKADDYKKGPKGSYECEISDDVDAVLTFNKGTVTFEYDGDEEDYKYYCYKHGKDVTVFIYDPAFLSSDFYEHNFDTTLDCDDNDKSFEFGGYKFKKSK